MRERINALMDQRAKAWGECTALLDESAKSTEGRRLQGESLEKFERAQADVSALTREIEALEVNLRQEADLARTLEDKRPLVDADGKRTGPEASRDEYNDVFKRFLTLGMSELESRDKMILRGGMAALDPEVRALGIATGSAGGYTVPEGFWARISEVQKWFGGIEAAGVNVLTTDTGADLPWATNDDTGNVGALLGENVQVTDLDVAFGARLLSAHTYTTRQIKVSLQLIQDGAFDIEAFIAKKFGQRLGRIHNTHFTNGTGTGQPQGLITAAVTGKTAAGANAITYPDVIDLIHSVDPAYRNAPGVKFMFHDLILAALQKLVDSQGRPLWLPSVREGAPDQFLGYGYVVNNDMASTIATTIKTMAFGDFSQGYVARKVKGVTMLRLDERYADFLQVGFLGFDRVDGMVDDSAAFKLLVQP